EALNGTTLWNGSIPDFNGTFDSGTAPFWQLAYFSNAAQAVLIVTSLNGHYAIHTPIPLSNDCAAVWDNFRSDPTYWANQIDQNGVLPVDSPIVGRVAWNNLDRTWILRNLPLAEVLEVGPGVFTGTGDVNDGNWMAFFMGCGVVDKAGIQPLYAAGVSRDGLWGGVLNGTTNCAIQYSTPPTIDEGYYEILPLATTLTNDSNTAWATTTFQIGIAYLNGTLFTYDGWGVADWMVRVTVEDSEGQALAAAGSDCPSWVQAIADCESNSSGWYVVLLSGGGEWIASYGTTPGGTNWSIPVTAIVSHQQITVVVPRTWMVSGDKVVFNSTVASSVITGALTL